MTYENARYKNSGNNEGDVLNFFNNQLRNLVQKNGGDNTFATYTEDFHDKTPKNLTVGERTKLMLTHPNHTISQIEKSFIEMEVNFQVYFEIPLLQSDFMIDLTHDTDLTPTDLKSEAEKLIEEFQKKLKDSDFTQKVQNLQLQTNNLSKYNYVNWLYVNGLLNAITSLHDDDEDPFTDEIWKQIYTEIVESNLKLPDITDPSICPPINPKIDYNPAIVYFSVFDDKVNQIATKIQNFTTIQHLYKIEASVPYTKEDLDFNNNDSRGYKEINDKFYQKPMLSNFLFEFAQYSHVVLIFPLWMNKAPPLIKNF